MRQKGLSKILLIIVLLIIGVGGYVAYKEFFSPKITAQLPTPSATPDEMESWQIINNAGYKYSIKYPPTLKSIATGMFPDLNNANEVVISEDPNKEGLPVMYIEATQKVETVYKDLSLQEIAQEDFNANVENKNTFIKTIKEIEPTTFAGVPAYAFQIESKGFSGKWQGFLTLTGVNNVLEFDNAGFHYTIFYSEDPVFSDLLKTFKFIQ